VIPPDDRMHGTIEALTNHCEQMAVVETENLRRSPEQAVPPQRTAASTGDEGSD
jgi:hypothetical protein